MEIVIQMLSEAELKYVGIRFALLIGMFLSGGAGFALFLMHLITATKTKPVWHGLAYWGLAIVLGVIALVVAFMTWEDLKKSVYSCIAAAFIGPFYLKRWIDKGGKTIENKI